MFLRSLRDPRLTALAFLVFPQSPDGNVRSAELQAATLPVAAAHPISIAPRPESRLDTLPSTGRRGLAPLHLPWDHPAREVLEFLHASGRLRELPALEVGTLSDRDLIRMRGNGGNDTADAWARAWEEGIAPPLEEGEGRGFATGGSAGATGRSGDDLLRSGHRLGGWVDANARLTRHWTGGVELPVRPVRGRPPDPALHVTGEWSGAVLTLGRTRPRVGPGADELLLAGTLPLSGGRLSNGAPFRLPGFLSGLGVWNASLLVARPGEAGVVEDPWYGALALTLDPIPGLRIGGARTALFGGDGMPGVTAGRLLRMIGGRHSTDAGEFEDQYAQLFFRARIPVAEQSVVVYGSYAVNDTEAAFRDDPALLAGLLIPLAPDGWLGGIRYEYHAFGARARVCTWCAVRRERTWFTHYVFGEHVRDGLPFGSTLGGYGARHRIRWSGWSPSARWRVSVEGTAEVREGTNLLLDRWPGKRREVLLRAGYRPSGRIRLEAGGGFAGGPEMPTAATLELSGILVTLGTRE